MREPQKELLELAAKAAGLKLADPVDSHIPSGGVWVVGKDGNDKVWNPLNDSRTALDLSITLNIAIEPRDDTGEVYATFMGSTGAKLEFIETREPFGGDKYTATRRAIVKAAAAIGRRMGNGN